MHKLSRPATRLALTLMIGAICMMILPVSAQDQTYVVQPGDNLYRIAERFGTTVSALAESNDITLTWQILVGQTLTIPGLSAEPEAAPIVEVAAAEPVYHTVTWGESLATIAQRYAMTLDQVARLNDITNPDLIYVGQQLIVSGAPEAAAAGDAPALAPANVVENLAPLPLVPNYSVALAPVLESAATVTVGTTSHTVGYGESLSMIARQYSVSVLAITQANNIYDANTIFVGQTLTIPTTNALSVPETGISTVAAAPPPRFTVGREIIVDLSDQRIYAYENGVLVRNVLVSTGLPGTPTVRGSYTIQRKYVAQTMAGPGYYLPDVPYVLYFFAGYALHGTYWHDDFGQPRSHGCVNLPTPEAEWFYNWADVGTPIMVQV